MSQRDLQGVAPILFTCDCVHLFMLSVTALVVSTSSVMQNVVAFVRLHSSADWPSMDPKPLAQAQVDNASS